MDDLNLNKVTITEFNLGNTKTCIYNDKYIVNKKTLYRPV